MKLQELINDSEIDMTIANIKAFFLGALTAEKPMPFHLAVKEMLAENPGVLPGLEPELKKLWDELVKNKPAELQALFPITGNLKEYLSNAKDQLDFYLTALSLAGTNVDTCSNEDVADLIDELEDTVMDLDEYISGPDADAEEGEELKEMMLEAWQDYLRTSKQ